MQNGGKRTVHTRNVGIFPPRKIEGKKSVERKQKKER